jgi:hypothetical protein
MNFSKHLTDILGEQPLQLVDSRIDLNGQILIAKASQPMTSFLHILSSTLFVSSLQFSSPALHFSSFSSF